MKYVMAASTATTTAINRTINIGDLNGFGGRSDIALLDVASRTPHASGAWPSLERGGVSSTHPRNVRLRRARAIGDEVVSRCSDSAVVIGQKKRSRSSSFLFFTHVASTNDLFRPASGWPGCRFRSPVASLIARRLRRCLTAGSD